MRHLRLLFGILLPGAMICSFAASASAQTDPPPAATAPPVVSHSGVASSGRGGGHFGVGGVAYLAPGSGGLSLAYDPGIWHLDTVLGLSGGNGATDLLIGARFWYHLQSVGSADFSLGAGMSYQRQGARGMGNNAADLVYAELGALIRIFLVPNVALGAAAGLVIATADADGYSLGPANLVGSASIHYYF
jgi:hypothetical protein